MPIFDFNGSNDVSISRLYDNNGSADTPIKVVYDYDGTDHIVYQSDQIIYNNGQQVLPLWAGLQYTNEGGAGWGDWSGQGNKYVGINDYYAQIEYLSNEVYMHARGYYSANGSSCFLSEQSPINLSNYSKFIVEMKGNAPSSGPSTSTQQIAHGTYLVVKSSNGPQQLGYAHKQLPIAITNDAYHTYEMDISDVTGSYYIGAYVGSNTVYNPEVKLYVRSMKLI